MCKTVEVGNIMTDRGAMQRRTRESRAWLWNKVELRFNYVLFAVVVILPFPLSITGMHHHTWFLLKIRVKLDIPSQAFIYDFFEDSFFPWC